MGLAGSVSRVRARTFRLRAVQYGWRLDRLNCRSPCVGPGQVNDRSGKHSQAPESIAYKNLHVADQALIEERAKGVRLPIQSLLED
jgi:hypothetical protein